MNTIAGNLFRYASAYGYGNAESVQNLINIFGSIQDVEYWEDENFFPDGFKYRKVTLRFKNFTPNIPAMLTQILYSTEARIILKNIEPVENNSFSFNVRNDLYLNFIRDHPLPVSEINLHETMSFPPAYPEPPPMYSAQPTIHPVQSPQPPRSPEQSRRIGLHPEVRAHF